MQRWQHGEYMMPISDRARKVAKRHDCKAAECPAWVEHAYGQAIESHMACTEARKTIHVQAQIEALNAARHQEWLDDLAESGIHVQRHGVREYASQDAWVRWIWATGPAIHADDYDIASALGWVRSWRGPGQSFTHMASVRRSGHSVLVTQFGGLDT